MATFLDDLSIYNAKAATAITLAVTAGNSERANLMSSLRSTANDISLTEDVRLNALTALINVGDLLDIPLPPYFPVTSTFANSQTYIGLHNELSGLDVEPYLHLTTAEKSFFSNKANLGDISFANLLGVYTSNTGLRDAINGKQNALNGTGLVRANAGTITYDSSVYITSISGIAAGGDLDGEYPNPTLRNTSVTGQLLTGFDISAPTGSVTGANTILSAIETLNANVNNVIATSGTINEIRFSLPSTVFDFTAGPFTSGAANIGATFRSKSQNYFFAGPASGGADTPDFRAIFPEDFPVVPGLVATTYGSAISIPQIAVDVYGRVTAIANVTAAGGGRVDTIVYNVPTPVFTTNVVQGTTATITLGLGTQIKNTVWAGPETGADLTPSFRSLVVDDIPTLPLTKIPDIDGLLALKLGDSLNVNLIFMGNASSKAVQTRVGGDLTASFSGATGSNVGTFTIANKAVTYAKFQDIPSEPLNATRPILLGRFDITQGPIQELTLDPTAFVLNDEFGTIGLVSPNPPSLEDVGDLLTSTGDNNLVRLPVGASGSLLMPYNSGIDPNPGLIWGNVQGDISYTVDSTTTPGTPFGAFAIGANKVTLSKIQKIGLNTILGNKTANPDDVSALTVTEVTAMLEQFGLTRQGVVPAATGLPVAPNALQDYTLRANGAWVLGGGGGSGTVGNGTQYQLAYYNGAGTTTSVIGWTVPTVDRALISNANGLPTASATTATELGYVSGVSSAIQTQINGKEPTISILSIAKGGTNGSATPTAGGVSYGTSTAYAFTAAGTTAGQIFQSNVASAPTWSTATYPSTTTLNKILYSSANNVVGEINAPTSADTFLKWTGSAFTWAGAGSGSGTVTSANQYSIPYYSVSPSGTTVTGLTPDTGTDGRKFLSQVITSGNAAAPVWVQSTGSGSVVLDFSPALTTPDIGNAIADSINNVVITATASTTTLTIANTKAFTVSNTLTFTGADNSSVAFGAGGTVAYIGLANSWASGIKQTFAPSTTVAGINVGTFAGQPSIPVNGDLVYNSTATALQAYINGAWVSLGAGVTIPVSVANGGTGQSSALTQWGAIYANATTSMASTAAGTTGTILIGSTSAAPSFSATPVATNITLGIASTTPGSIILRNSVNANTQTITGTNYNSGASNVQYLWPTNAPSVNQALLASAPVGSTPAVITLSWGAPASTISIGSAITSATAGSVLFAGTGTPGVLAQSNANFFWDNTNFRLGIGTVSPGAALSIRAGSGTGPQISLIASSLAGSFSAATNGNIWYDTTAGNSSLNIYKDSAYTKFLTLNRNPDFAVGTTTGIVVSDNLGNFTKSADLTALGVYSVYADTGNITTNLTETTMIGTSLVGSTTLPANFFAVGKTLRIFASGTVTNAGGNDTTIRFKLGGTTIGTFSITTMQNVTTNGFVMEAYIICNAAGASGTVRIGATFFVEGNTGENEHTWYLPLATQSGTINTTTSLAMDVTNQWGQTTCTMVVNFMTCYYLN